MSPVSDVSEPPEPLCHLMPLSTIGCGPAAADATPGWADLAGLLQDPLTYPTHSRNRPGLTGSCLARASFANLQWNYPMSYNYALNVVRRRDVNGRSCVSGISRVFASTRATANQITEVLGLGDDLRFIVDSDHDLTSIMIGREAVLLGRFDAAKQLVNGEQIGGVVNLNNEIQALIDTKQDLATDTMARLFLELA